MNTNHSKPSFLCKRCGAITTNPVRLCKKHRYLHHSKPESKPYHTKEWQEVRQIKLAANPLCELCELDQLTTPATHVHHIDGNPKNNKQENLQSLCYDHHECHHSRLGCRLCRIKKCSLLKQMGGWGAKS